VILDSSLLFSLTRTPSVRWETQRKPPSPHAPPKIDYASPTENTRKRALHDGVCGVGRKTPGLCTYATVTLGLNMHEMGGSCPLEAGRSGEQVREVLGIWYFRTMEYTSISCHANGWFLFLFLFFGGGKSVGDDVSCSRSWGPWTEADSLQTARISHDFTWEKR